MINSKSYSRSVVLDYIKTACILFVIITHLDWTDTQRTTFLFPFSIDMAVPAFMIISGYVNMLSIEKRSINTINKWYSVDVLFPKLITILAPYVVVYIFMATVFLAIGRVTSKEAIFAFFTGGWGPGSYYVPIMIQLIFFFPLMEAIVRRYNTKGYIILLIVNVLLEACFTYFQLPVWIYRLSFFRYIVFVCAGMYLYRVRDKINKALLAISFAFGFLYIMAVNYLGYDPKVFTNWITTSFPTVFYIFPLVAFAIIYLNKPIPKKYGGQILNTIGKTTYHIYLVQMVWYSSFGNLLNPRIMLIPNIVVCVLVGIIFSKLDNRFVQKPLRCLFDNNSRNPNSV